MVTSDPTLLSSFKTRRARRPRWPWVIFALCALLVVAAVIASRITLSYYVLVPGQAQSVRALLTLPADRVHTLHGSVLLTDVGVGPVSAFEYLPDRWNKDDTLVRTSDLLGTTPASEFSAQGTVEMTESQLVAGATAERQLGLPVPEKDAGVVIYQTSPGTGAFKALQVGQVITAVDGTATPDTPTLVAAVRSHAVGQSVTLSLGTMTDPTRTRQVSVRLSGLKEDGMVEPVIGVVGFDQPVYDMPFPVSIASDNIGGPSAGLAFTLGILDTVAGGELTGGRIVAATGTIHPDGSVGAVGGVLQKTIAVENAGASVFLVPASEYAQAKGGANTHLRVLPVNNLAQAIADLTKLGGHSGAAGNGPLPGPDGHSAPADWQTTPWD
jgi:PDZ domain-containing protein